MIFNSRNRKRVPAPFPRKRIFLKLCRRFPNQILACTVSYRCRIPFGKRKNWNQIYNLFWFKLSKRRFRPNVWFDWQTNAGTETNSRTNCKACGNRMRPFVNRYPIVIWATVPWRRNPKLLPPPAGPNLRILIAIHSKYRSFAWKNGYQHTCRQSGECL